MSKLVSFRFATLCNVSTLLEGGSSLKAMAKGLGDLCFLASTSVLEICREVFQAIKNGYFPVENLGLAYTPLTDLSSLSNILQSDGFEIKETSYQNIFTAVQSETGKELMLFQTEQGMGLFSPNQEVITSSLQKLVTTKLTDALEEMGFRIKREKKGEEIVITAEDKEKNQVQVEIQPDLTAKIDSRRSKKPKCDLIHQLINKKLKERQESPNKVILQTAPIRKDMNIYLRIRRK